MKAKPALPERVRSMEGLGVIRGVGVQLGLLKQRSALARSLTDDYWAEETTPSYVHDLPSAQPSRQAAG